ncbi:hypothetical protein BsWGS_15218 [Bradybaena similaris]
MDRRLQIRLWATTAVTSLFLAALDSSSVRYDFEGDTSHPWTTNNDAPFHRVLAADMMFHRGLPMTDTTLSTAQGHYVYASYDAKLNTEYGFLNHNCHSPTGPRCLLTFYAIIHAPSFYLATRPRCDMCSGNSSMSSLPWQVVQLNNTLLHQEWTFHNITLGAHPVAFDIEFIAYVPHMTDFVALDDLELTDCEPEPQKDLTCPEDANFRCSGLQECLSRDQQCDLQDDCLCKDDEATCDDVFQSHPEGFLRLDKCDFDSGACLWYNVARAGPSDFRWRIKNTTSPEVLPHHKQSGSRPPPPDKTLHLAMSGQPAGSVAILRSVSFQALLSGNSSCQARFWYRNTAPNAVLHLELLEVTHKAGSRSVKTLWKTTGTEHKRHSDPGDPSSAKSDPNFWDRAVVDVNSEPINFSYVLQFKVTSSGPSDLSSLTEVAIHSISLDRQCFNPALTLTSCGAGGAQGPSQQECDQHYGENSEVSVLEDGHFRGVQSWTVPETMVYRIQALGSKGGLGNVGGDTSATNLGSSVTARFKLQKGEKLYFLIGQTGDSCLASLSEFQDDVMSASIAYSNSSHMSGGGGGGGATVVFSMTTDGRVQQVLMLAGSGAGLPLQSEHRLLDMMAPSLNNHQANNDTEPMSDQEAELFMHTSLEGSLPCLELANKSDSCYGRGGFGAGGGACDRGGNGGGANTAQNIISLNATGAGLPGRSYIHGTALYRSISAGTHQESGAVKVFPDDDGCDCDYMCLWLDYELTSPTCLCRDNHTAPCPMKKTHRQQTTRMFPMVILGTLLAVFIIVVCLCLYLQRHALRTRNPTSMKQVASFLCPCIDLSRRAISLSAHVLPQIQRPPAIMHVNPNYNNVTMKFPEHTLKELPRKHIKLVSPLGQGAFGEVYYGLMSNVPMIDGDLAVAVKTLPPVCTEQTEMDFLMEAVIVSKFNHPNIVKLIGVCFEQRPHYLVLELLEGGDLKSFLRQARPKWDQPSSLTVLDLLRLCLDVSRGCQHLEEKHFIHRDIAARNCLLTTKAPSRTAKIADFGMARDIYRSDYYKKSGKAMLPVKWMPPEAFLDGVFTSKTDVWSFGILMWEVFSLGHMPYPGCSNEEVMNLVTQGGRLDPPESCPSPVFDIMASCWSALPEGRPNFSLIIASLERTLQDDDMVSRGLPVFYVPPIINTRGLRLQDNPVTKSSRPKVTTTRAVTMCSNSTFIPNMSDGYLEPLLTQSSRSQSHDSHLRSPPYNFACDTYSKASAASSGGLDSGQVFIDKEKTANKPMCRTPRVFYKPGSNFHSEACTASEALLPAQNSMAAHKQSLKDDQGFSGEQKYELCVNMNGLDASQEADSEDFKPSQPVAANNKKQSYTNFPAPPT